MIRQKRQAVQADSALREIQQLIDRGDYAIARRKIRSRLLFSSASSTLLHEAARLERRAGNLKAAISYYQRLLALSAHDAGALNGLGLAGYDSGDWQQAEHYYQQALHVLPDYAACLNNYAILLHKQFRHQDAISCYQRVLARDPSYREGAYGLSTLYAHNGQLAPLWQVPGIRWVSLQKGAGEEEVLPCAATQPALALGPRFHDYADTASAIAQLDLVISVDTSVAHLAGSMGKPCWVMVPGIATDWRWTAGREDSLWYPQMRLFYRHQDEEWAAVIARIACALETWVKQQ
jgi:tetratricopeptide (TPR) repeat protein